MIKRNKVGMKFMHMKNVLLMITKIVSMEEKGSTHTGKK